MLRILTFATNVILTVLNLTQICVVLYVEQIVFGKNALVLYKQIMNVFIRAMARLFLFGEGLITPFNSAIAKNIYSVAITLFDATVNEFNAGWVECGENKNMEKIFFALPL
mgnify:FL=1